MQNSLLAYNHGMRLLRIILLAGAIVFGLAAVVAIIAPRLLLTELGLQASPSAVWNISLMGFLLAALSGNMATVSRTSTNRGVTAASLIMTFAALGLGFVTLSIPTEFSWLSSMLIIVGFGFALAYVIGLLGLVLSRRLSK